MFAEDVSDRTDQRRTVEAALQVHSGKAGTNQRSKSVRDQQCSSGPGEGAAPHGAARLERGREGGEDPRERRHRWLFDPFFSH